MDLRKWLIGTESNSCYEMGGGKKRRRARRVFGYTEFHFLPFTMTIRIRDDKSRWHNV
jgi:hypothetical protein